MKNTILIIATATVTSLASFFQADTHPHQVDEVVTVDTAFTNHITSVIDSLDNANQYRIHVIKSTIKQDSIILSNKDKELKKKSVEIKKLTNKVRVLEEETEYPTIINITRI